MTNLYWNLLAENPIAMYVHVEKDHCNNLASLYVSDRWCDLPLTTQTHALWTTLSTYRGEVKVIICWVSSPALDFNFVGPGWWHALLTGCMCVFSAKKKSCKPSSPELSPTLWVAIYLDRSWGTGFKGHFSSIHNPCTLLCAISSLAACTVLPQGYTVADGGPRGRVDLAADLRAYAHSIARDGSLEINMRSLHKQRSILVIATLSGAVVVLTLLSKFLASQVGRWLWGYRAWEAGVSLWPQFNAGARQDTV